MGLTDKSLYAYCDSNPLSRADVEGDFWHIVVGAAVGGVIGGIVSVVSNAVSGEPWNKDLGTAILASAAGGALGASGVGAAGMIVGSAAISMAENTINQVSENKGFQNFNIGDMLIDTAIGGIFGAIGGPGTGNKHLNNLGKQTIVRTKNTTVKKGLQAGAKEATKAFSYYGKNTRSYYRGFIRGIPIGFALNGSESFLKSDLMKRNYSHLFGG